MKRYRLEGPVGEGAIGVVHLATDLDLERLVAVKILKPEAAANPNLRKRFLREARLCARMDHPNVVRVYDAGEEDGEIYLVMEYIEGEPLSAVLERGDVELPSLMQILERVARGVHHAHKLGIVHRDLKPANILVTQGGVPKVADFGLAHLEDSGGSVVTRTGAALGTPLYMAPEQAEGRVHELSARTDVYALGAILYEMATGRTPFDGRNVMEIYDRIVHQDPTPVRTLNREVHVDVEKIAMKALRKDSSRRQASAAEFAEDLRRHLLGGKIQSSTESLTVPEIPPRAPRKADAPVPTAGAPWWMVWSLGVVAAVGVVTAMVMGILLARHPAPVTAVASVSPAEPKPDTRHEDLLAKARGAFLGGRDEDALRLVEDALGIRESIEARELAGKISARIREHKAEAALVAIEKSPAAKDPDEFIAALDQFLQQHGQTRAAARAKALRANAVGKAEAAAAFKPEEGFELIRPESFRIRGDLEAVKSSVRRDLIRISYDPPDGSKGTCMIAAPGTYVDSLLRFDVRLIRFTAAGAALRYQPAKKFQAVHVLEQPRNEWIPMEVWIIGRTVIYSIKRSEPITGKASEAIPDEGAIGFFLDAGTELEVRRFRVKRLQAGAGTPDTSPSPSPSD